MNTNAQTTPGRDARARRWLAAGPDPILGAVLIARNEAQRLADLFDDLSGLVDEVVVVDTGSTDGTAAVCDAWGVRRVAQPWTDDFAAARNRSIEEATARYLLWLDADDRVPPETRAELAALRDRSLPAERRFYSLPVQSPRERYGATTVRQIRLFPRVDGVRFTGIIGERLDASLAAAGIEGAALDCPIVHHGLATDDEVRRKAVRDLPLLERALSLNPEDPELLLRRAQAAAALGRHAEAEAVTTRAMAVASHDRRRLADLLTLRSALRRAAGFDAGATSDLEAAVRADPARALPAMLLGEQKIREGEWESGMRWLNAARDRDFSPGDVSFPIDRARSNLEFLTALACLRHSDEGAADGHLGAALEIDPSNVDARLERGRLLLRRGDPREARCVLEPAGTLPEARTRFIDVSATIGLARALAGDLHGAAACLAPLLDIFADELDHADSVDPLDLAEVLLRAGHRDAAADLMSLHRHAARAA